MTTTEGTITYEYDDANRLTKVGDTTYTWDERGNLTYDGTFTYTYNSAGRMVRAENVTATLLYTYTADGLRVAQSVDGDATTYAWDWASGLPEMLIQSPNPQSPNPQSLYLVGHDTLGRFADGEWAYHLPDALGSVRQVVDGAGSLVGSREWTPFGVEVGDAQAGLGYTGEWSDPSVGLTYLRARWLAPSVGRFASRDPFPGSVRLPSSLHQYAYVRNNPTLLIDPSGLVPPPPSSPPLPSLSFDSTVEEVIDFFEWVYDKNGFVNCSLHPDDRQHPTDTSWDLFIDYVCEYGPEHRYFNADDSLTQELAKSRLIHHLRFRFYYPNKAEPMEGTENFGIRGFYQASEDFLEYGAYEDFLKNWPNGAPGRIVAEHFFRYSNIVHFMGSFWYTIRLEKYNGRASGSHIPLRYPDKHQDTLEDLVAENPDLASEPAIQYIVSHSVVSVLKDRLRGETIDSMGGGMMWQHFTWAEPYPLLGCGKELPPWPTVIQFLDIYNSKQPGAK